MAGTVTMNNMELTNAVHAMNAQITELGNKLEKVIPEIYQKISDSESDISILFKSLKNDWQPYVEKIVPIHDEAQLQYQKLEDIGNNLTGRIDAVLIEIEDKFLTVGSQVDDLQKAMQAAQDSLAGASSSYGVEAQARATMSAKIDSVVTATENLGLDLEHQKRSQSHNYNQIQLQLATATQAASDAKQGSSGGGSRSSEPLATHKLLVSEKRIDGSEPVAALEDWFDLITMKINLIYPGAQSILDWAGSEGGEITTHMISGRMDASLATKPSLELFVLLKCKTELAAGNHLKPISSERGLEAWRILKKELMGRDGPRQEEEFNAIDDLPSSKHRTCRGSITCMCGGRPS